MLRIFDFPAAAGLAPVSVCFSISIFILSACLTIVPRNPDQLRVGLESTIRVLQPSGAGPFPTVIILHGANEPTWRQGYADLS